MQLMTQSGESKKCNPESERLRLNDFDFGRHLLFFHWGKGLQLRNYVVCVNQANVSSKAKIEGHNTQHGNGRAIRIGEKHYF